MGGSLPSSNPILDLDSAPVPASPVPAGSSDLLSALLENSADRIYFKDLESRFIRINRYKARLMHLADPSEAIGKTDQDFLAGDRGTGRRLDELEIIQTGVPLIDKEEREEWPDGRVTWVSTSKMPLFNSAGTCIGTFGISRDITSRKLAESALENAHRDAELFIDSVPSILIGLDAENRIERWNLAAAKTFGISKAEACGKPLAGCGVRWLSDIDSEIRPLSAATEPVRWDVSYAKNDEERFLGFTLRWIKPFTSDKPELLIVGTDITERKRADEELRWKTALLEAQTNAAGAGILIVESAANVLLQNRQMNEMFRVPAALAETADAELLLKHVLGQVRDPDRFLADVRYFSEHPNETTRDEVELVDGRVLERYSAPVLGNSGMYYGRIWTFRDITHRKRTEDVLRRLSMAVEQSPASVVMTDPQGNITYVNRKFVESSGYEAAEVVGKNPKFLKSGFTTAEDYRELWRTIKAGEEWRGVFHNRKKTGELYWESAVIRPIEDHTGAITHFLGLKEDITEKLAMEGQLRQSQKLEAIGQLAAGIAHEINTPIQYVGDNTSFLKESWGKLAGLLAAAQKLRDEVSAGSVSQETIACFDECRRIADVEYLSQDIPHAIDQTLDGVQRVAKIVRAMKEFSHPGSQEKRAVDLNRAIETTVTISRNEWKYVAEVETHLDPNLPLVPCLAGEINQVVLNLVVNAAHAIADVSREQGGGLGKIMLSTRKDGDWAEISVADTGTGIPEAARERVFDPFFTTKEVGKGTGQGLMLAHNVVVKKHGGRIWFESEVGKGTTFFVRLPL
jgi:PAS domain S-box-containing protein